MDKSKYNGKCKECGSDCYLGLSELVCSNMFCKHYKADEIKVIQKCEEKVCDDKDKCDDCKQAPIPGYNPLNPFTSPPDSNDCSFTKTASSPSSIVWLDNVVGTFTWGNCTADCVGVKFVPEKEKVKEVTTYNLDNVLIVHLNSLIHLSDGICINNPSSEITYYVTKEPPKDGSICDKLMKSNKFTRITLKHKEQDMYLNFCKTGFGYSVYKTIEDNDPVNLFSRTSDYYLGKNGVFFKGSYGSLFVEKQDEFIFSSLDEIYNKLVEVMDFKFEDYE